MVDLKKYWFQVLVLSGLFVLFISIQYFAPKPQNWTPTFAKDDKIPYGNYILFSQLNDIFPDQEIEVNDYTFFESGEEVFNGNSNLILIAQSYSKMDSLDNQLMLQHVKSGAHVFIATEQFNTGLSEELKLDVSMSFNWLVDSSFSEPVYFVNPQLKSDDGYIFPKKTYRNYFSSFDTANVLVLGKEADSLVNYIRVRYGKGVFWLHCQPTLFTNYNILYKNNHEYVERALSYLPRRKTIWDEYYHHYSKKKQTSLRYIFQQPALHAAWLLLLFGMLIYVIFEGKRIQRIIPILTPPRNHSLEFITTMGRLYFHRKDNRDLAMKKFTYFVDHIREKYYVNIQETNLKDAQEVAQQLDIHSQIVEKLFAHYSIIVSKRKISADELIEFNKLVDDFYIHIQQ